jgi:hypothetical protein
VGWPRGWHRGERVGEVGDEVGLLQEVQQHVNTLLLQQVLAEPAWAKKLTDEDRRGLTALFWSNINPYGTFRLDMDKRLDLLSATVPVPRRAADDAARPAGSAL